MPDLPPTPDLPDRADLPNLSNADLETIALSDLQSLNNAARALAAQNGAQLPAQAAIQIYAVEASIMQALLLSRLLQVIDLEIEDTPPSTSALLDKLRKDAKL